MISYPVSYPIGRPIYNVMSGGGQFPGSSEAFDFMGSTAGTPISGSPLVFSRPSNATMFRPTDAWEVFAPNNMLTWSEDYSNAAWPKTGAVTTTLSSSTPVQGFSTIFEYNQGASATGAEFLQNQFSATSGQKYTQSWYIKKGGSNPTSTVSVVFGGGVVWPGGNIPGATFNLDTGVVNGFTGTVDSTTNVLLPDGSRLISVTATAAGGGLPTSRIYTNIANGTFLISGTQVELGPYVQTYNKTLGSVYYGPRYDTNPTTLASRGLLYEPARTNLVLYSNDKANASWSKTFTTVTSNIAISPEGVQNADLLTATGIGTNDSLVSAAVAASPSTAYTGSAHFKRGNTDWVRFFVADAADPANFQARVWVNTATGTIGQFHALGLTIIGATVTQLPNGWCRATVSCTTAASTAQLVAFSYCVIADNSAVRVDGSTRYEYGTQIELGANPTSYIPTAAATATRASESETFDMSTIFNAAQGTIYAEFELDPATSGQDVRPFSISDGTVNNRIQILRNAGNAMSIIQVSGGVGGGQVNLAGPYVSGVVKVAITYTNGGNIQCAINGVLSGTQVFTSPVGTLTGYFSGNSGAGPGNGPYWNRKFAYYRNAMTPAQLQAMTV